MDSPDPDHDSKRRWLRPPSIGVLLVIAFFVLCGGMLVAFRVSSSGIRQVEALGGEVYCRSNTISDFVTDFIDIDRDLLATDSDVHTVALGGLGPKVTDQALQSLRRFESLDSLFIIDTAVTDDGLDHLAAATSLTKLHLYDCPNITDAGMFKLARLKRLTDLDLAGLQVTGAGIAQATQVEYLQVVDCPNVDDTMLEKFGGNHSLTFLSVYDSPRITDAGLTKLSRLPRLVGLVLNGMQVTGEGIAPLIQLGTLHLESCPNVDDATLERIRGLHNLYDLSVRDSAVTDAGLPHLAALPNLTILSLEQLSGITDEGVLELAALKSLESLSISSSHISADAAAKLSEALPKCDVHHE